MSVVDQVKSRLDIVDVVGGYVQLKKAGRNYKGLCPFHGEKTPSFIVFPDTQTWRCFGQCGDGGDIFGFVMKREGWDFHETLQELARRAGIELQAQQRVNPQQEVTENRRYDLLSITAEFFMDALPNSPAEQYVVTRGLTPATVQQFGVGYAPDEWSALLTHLTQLGFQQEEIIEAGVAIRNDKGKVYDRFRHRLIIPIRDEKGRTIGFGARALDKDQEPKYLNSPQGELFDKSRTLYGFDLARRSIRESETAIIVEGYMDVIQAHQNGFTNVVAQMGTALTEHQLRILAKYANRLILALDTDLAGIKATMRGLDVARETLGDQDVFVLDAKGMMQQAGQLNLDLRVLQLPHGKDPDEFLKATPHLWEEQVAAALPLAEYVIKVGTADLGGTTSIQEREARALELLPLLTATEDNIQQLTNVQLLSHALRLDPKTMVEWALARTQRTQPPLPPPKKEDKWGGRSSRLRDKKVAPPPRYAASPVSLAMRGRELEKYCLSSLLRDPQRLFEGNRLLREVGNTVSEEMSLPLQVADFSQGDFQAIFALLEKACQQDEVEPLSYMLQHVDISLMEVIDEMLQEPLEVFARKASKLHVTELQSVQQEQNRRQMGNRDEFPLLLLRLRRDRIQQESKEIYFLLTEAQENRDTELEQLYTGHFSSLAQRIRMLNLTLNKMQQGS